VSSDEPDRGWVAIARHVQAIATVRAFAEESGAERVAVVLDAGGGEAVLLECLPGEALELTVGEDAYVIPPDATAAVVPLAVDIPRSPPATAVEVDVELEQILAPIGVLPALADGVMSLARALGGRTIAAADFPTREPERPMTIAARDGEGVVVAVGDTQFEL
jgi:hypothetical protein